MYSAERAITVWWVLFNKPSECAGYDSTQEGPHCSLNDVMSANMDAMITIFNASGGHTD